MQPSDGGQGGGGGASACRAGTGPTEHNSTITANETWSAATSPHVVTFGITIATGATLTIEPCAEVRLGKTYGIDVRGRLVAEGTASAPIRFTADDATKPWSFIGINKGSGSLAFVTLENGGDPADPNGRGLIDVRGDAFAPRQQLLKLSNVTLSGSGTAGLSLRDGATLTSDSTNLTIRGAKNGPVISAVRLAGNLPTGSYTGNTRDSIALTNAETVSEDTVLRALGVPYFIGSTEEADIRVGVDGAQPARAVLTIEAGTTLQFGKNSRITMVARSNPVTAYGALIARGTAEKPITFTSAAANPAAGDWVGLIFRAPDAANALDHILIEYTGAPTQTSGFHCVLTPSRPEDGDNAAVVLLGGQHTAFLTNSTLRDGAAYGVDRGWQGAPVDFTPTNTFARFGLCAQSLPFDAAGRCPATVTCP